MNVIEEHGFRVRGVSTGGHLPTTFTHLLVELHGTTTEERKGQGLVDIVDQGQRARTLYAKEGLVPWEFLIWPGPLARLTFLQAQTSHSFFLPLACALAEVLRDTNPG
eukprot:4418452-Pleurochrysis_carterae.AAC.1